MSASEPCLAKSARYFSTTWDYSANFLLVPGHWLNFGDDVLNLWFADLMLIVSLLTVVPTLAYVLSRGRQRSQC